MHCRHCFTWVYVKRYHDHPFAIKTSSPQISAKNHDNQVEIIKTGLLVEMNIRLGFREFLVTRATREAIFGSHNGTMIGFEAKLENAKILANLLYPIYVDEMVSCIASAEGLRFMSDYVDSIQAVAFLDRKLFSEYKIIGNPTAEKEKVSFSLKLAPILECINIFGTAGPSIISDSDKSNQGTTCLLLQYNENDRYLDIILEDQGVSTTCRFSTLDADHPNRFAFESSPVVCRNIMKANILGDALEEIDVKSSFLTLEFNQSDPIMSLHSVGDLGEISTEFGKNEDTIEYYSCSRPNKQRYSLKLFLQCKKALEISVKASFRINEEGFLGLQFMIPTDRQPAFVEYMLAPLVEEDSDQGI